MNKVFRFVFVTAVFCCTLCINIYAQQSTYCNPMDIDYKYNFEQLNEKISYRSGADPVIVNHKSEYFLFVTISGGYWQSKDLLNWKYITANRWPFEDMCAPAAVSATMRCGIDQSAVVVLLFVFHFSLCERKNETQAWVT